MNGFESPIALGLMVAAQVLGVFIAGAARLSIGSPFQSASQVVFLLALPLMGAATGMALTVGPGMLVGCAASLAVMVLMTTCDFRVRQRTCG